MGYCSIVFFNYLSSGRMLNRPLLSLFDLSVMKNTKRYLFLLLFCLFAAVGFTQTFTEKWAVCLGGTEWDEAKGIMLADSSYWVIGTTESNNGDVTGFKGNRDMWLVNLDINGNLISEKTLGGSGYEFGYTDIKKLNDTVFYIFGATNSSDGDVQSNRWPESSGNLWIIKTGNRGNIIWERVSGGQMGSGERDFIVTNDGGVLAMAFTDADDGDITDHHGWYDIWLIKLNENGQKQWTLSLGGTGLEGGGSVIQTSDRGFLVAGYTDGRGGGNYDSTCNFHNQGSGFVDAWVVKLDSTHNIEWQQCYGGSYHDSGDNVIELNDSYIIIGSTTSNDGDVSGFHGMPNYKNRTDIWVFKIDKRGNLLWQKCLGGSYVDYARNIFTTTDGGFMIVGRTRSDDGDVVGYHGLSGLPGYTYDIWFAKIDSMGNLLWQYCYGGAGDEYLYRGVHQKNDWDYVVAFGTTTTSWNFNSGRYLRPDYRIAELYDSTFSDIKKVKPAIQTLTVTAQPNPASNKVTFRYSLPGKTETARIDLYSATGKTIFTAPLTGNTGKLEYNCSLLKAGIYYYKVSTTSQTVSGKWVIVR